MTSAAGTYDAIVLGAGAAGLMCAIEAGKRGRRVAVIEHADRAGKKILISGGGRCNFTNVACGPENFICANPHFSKSALARYTPGDFIELVEAHGIAYHEKTLGQLFCDGSAHGIVAMLLRECAEAGVAIFTGTAVSAVALGGERGPLVREAEVSTSSSAAGGGFRETDFEVETREDGGADLLVRSSGPFLVRTAAGDFETEKMVIATGGLSIPQMGATGFGYEVARQFGLRVRECRPALVPLVLSEDDRDGLCDLAGVSAEVDVSVGRQRFREKLLVTHRGLSGPAVLQASSYWRPGEAMAIDWGPDRELLGSLLVPNARRDGAAARLALRGGLPARLADRLIEMAAPGESPAGSVGRSSSGGTGGRMGAWTNRDIAALEGLLHRWEFTPAGTEGYAKAEVTAGGVDTDELSAQTMEARRVPGLYFIGEVVDVTGQLGGFNFQWAWASGAAAGRAL